MNLSRRTFVSSVACAFAVAGIPFNSNGVEAKQIDDIMRWRQSPEGLEFVDMWGNKAPPMYLGDFVKHSCTGHVLGVVVGFRVNPWKTRNTNEGDFVAVGTARSPQGYQTWVSSSVVHCTWDDLPKIGVL